MNHIEMTIICNNCFYKNKNKCRVIITYKYCDLHNAIHKENNQNED